MNVIRPWLPGDERVHIKAAIDQRVRQLVPAPPNPDSVTRAAWRKAHPEQSRAYDQSRRQRRNELARARRAAANG